MKRKISEKYQMPPVMRFLLAFNKVYVILSICNIPTAYVLLKKHMCARIHYYNVLPRARNQRSRFLCNLKH